MATNARNAYTWLRERGITLEEGFVPALRRYAIQYQREHRYTYIDDVYRLIGTHKAHISYWESHPYSTQTKNFTNSGLS